MARTKQRTFNQDFTIVSGDAITGDDATGGAGGTLILEGGDAASGTNTDGGNVTIRPGEEDGSGTLGEVEVTNRSGTEDDPIIAFSSASGANAHTFRWRTGTVQPNSDSVPASDGGDLYVQSNGTIWIASAAGTGNWTQLGAGSATLETAVENTGATDANMDQSFDWRITDSDTLEFSNSDGSNPLLTVAPAAAGDNLTLGGTATSSTITAQGPTTGTGFFTITHGGADTVPLMTWTTSGSGGDSVQVFTGSSSPNGRVTGAIGSLFLDGTNGKTWVNTDGSTAWTDLTATGAGADPGIEGALYGNLQLYVDAGDRNSYDGTMGAVSGGTVTDLSGGATTTTTIFDFTDSHFNFNASTSHIDFGILTSDQEDIFATGGTVAAWVRAESDGEGNFGSVFRTANNTNTKGWFLAVEDESAGVVKFNFAVTRATLATQYKTARTIPLNEWVHVVVTYDGSDPATKFPVIYINGELYTWDSTQAGSGALQSDSGQHASIGARWVSGTTYDREWDGDIDMFQLWDRVLSAAEVRQLYRVTGEDRFRASLIGDDASTSTENAPDVEIKAGDGGSTSGAGGNIILEPGDVTSGTRGIVKATHEGADTDPIFQVETTGTNGEDIRMFVGDQDPDGTITGNPGDVYFTHSGASSIVSVNTGAGDSNTTWTSLVGGGISDLNDAVDAQVGAVTQTDRNIDWQITDTYTFTFEDSSAAELFKVAPTGSGNAVTVGGTASGDTVLVRGPTTGTGFFTITHGGADTVPLMTWTTSGSGGDSVQVFTGSSSPSTRVTGAIGSLFLDGTNGKAWVNTDGSTAWTDLTAGGDLNAAVDAQVGAVTQTDRNIDWQITDTYTFTFEDSAAAELFKVAPTASGNAVTVGGTGSGDQVVIQGPSTGAVRPKVTHAGADTVPVLQLETQGTNGEDIRVFVGDQDPNGTISGNPGDLYCTHSGTSSTLSVNVGASDANTTWTDLSTGGAGAVGISTLAQIDTGNQTTGSIAGSGGTASLDITTFINEGVIYELSVTRTAGTGGDDIDVEIFSKDTKLTGDRLYLAEAADASTAYIDASGIFYEDEDGSAELHIKITNNSAAAATFDVRARAQGESPVGQVKQIASWVMGDAVLPASNPAGTGTRGDHKILTFDQTTSEKGIFEGVIPEDYDGFSSFSLDLVWTGASAGSGTDTVKWDVTWRRMTDNSYDLDDNTYYTTGTQTSGAVTVPTTSGQVTRSTLTFTNANADGVQAGNAFRIQVSRDTAGDDFPDDGQLVRVQVHT